MVFIPKQTYFNLDFEKQERICNAAIDEFALNSFDNAKLSNIIKAAGIPRGSFYQYFEDKFDIYDYLISKAGEIKIRYMTDLLKNPQEVPFLTLFKEMYVVGVKFAIENPKYVQIVTHLISNKGEVFNRVMKDKLELAHHYYVDLINLDKERGNLRKDIDTDIFAKLVVDMTVNVSTDELNLENNEFNYEKMIHRITEIINIIEKGVKAGD